MFARLWLSSLLLLGLVGCMGSPLPEINYRAVMPPTEEANRALAIRFAERLAVVADLRINRDFARSASRKPESFMIVELRPNGGQNIVVAIMTDKSSNSFFVDISGSPRSAIAVQLGKSVERVFFEMYPGTELISYQRNGSLFGP